MIITSLTAEIYLSKHTIETAYYGPWFIAAGDVDNDEDIDFVSAAFSGNRIDWWENNGNQSFTRHLIANGISRPMGVCLADLNGDGFTDLAITSNGDHFVAWYENNGVEEFTQHIIGNWNGANFVNVADVNLDGYPDLIATACEFGPFYFGWFENDGAGDFTEHVVLQGWERSNCISAMDLDGDDDIDLLGTASIAGEIRWFENDGYENFSSHLITGDWGRPSSCRGIDLDQDGDMDFVATSCTGAQQVGWFENDGNQVFTLHIVFSNFNRPHSVFPVDLDQDGDIDLLATANIDNQIFWFENDGEQNFLPHLIADDFIGACYAIPVDLDRDNDPDILAVATQGNEISWWENLNEWLFPDFSALPVSGHIPLPVQFQDLSLSQPEINFWLWDFNADQTGDAFVADPVWVFSEPGRYDISLALANGLLYEEFIKADYIRVFDGESSLEFNEENSAAVCNASEELNLVTELTWEAWIKPSGWHQAGTMGFARILDKQFIRLFLVEDYAGLSYLCLGAWIFTADGGNSISLTFPETIELNNWQHVALVYSPEDGVQLVLNGEIQELIQTSMPTGNIQNNLDNNLILGNSPSFNYSFDGCLDEVRIWDTALSAETIAARRFEYLQGNEEHLKVYWAMNEGSGNMIGDQTIYNHQGQIINCLWDLGAPLNQSYLSESVLPPGELRLNVYPNPFNPGTTIFFSLPPDCQQSELIIFNCRGQKIKTYHINQSDNLNSSLPNPSVRNRNQDMNSITWDGTDSNSRPVSSGIYYAVLKHGEQIRLSGRMVLLK